MAGGVSAYAYLHSRVRAMYSTLLSPQFFDELYRAPDFFSLINQLEHTVYGPYLMRVDNRELTPRRAVFEMRSQMSEAYATVIRSSPEYLHPLLAQFYRSFEVDNLKAILRGILTGASWDRIRYVLFPFISTKVFPAETMLQEREIPAAIEKLRGTPYYATLSHALERYATEQSLFPLEVALDLSYWRAVWNDINQLSKLDREHALRVVGSLLDINNLLWAIRYRVYHQLSEEELINYTLPFGYHVKDADIRAIAAGADILEIVARLYPNLTLEDTVLMEPKDWLPELETKLQRHVVSQCRKEFSGYPFHAGIPLAYLVLKKMEIQDLTVLAEAKSAQLPPERFRPLLTTGAVSA